MWSGRLTRFSNIALAAAATLCPISAGADNLTTTVTNSYGLPGGLIDMPTAEMAPDGQLSATAFYFDGFGRSTLSFQITPWLSGSFRYSGTKDLTPQFSTYYDRSFDLKLRLVKEGTYTPAVAIGLQDFLGTGLLGAEYLVASKSFGDRLKVSGGFGWGRLGSRNNFDGFGTRDPFSFAGVGTGGDVDTSNWFRGDIGVFGGFTYDITDRLTFAAEYSSDGYDIEQAAGVFRRGSPYNFGLTYKLTPDANLRVYSLYGEKVGVSLTFGLNPKNMPVPGGIEQAPLPVAVRDPEGARDLGWATQPTARNALSEQLQDMLAKDQLDLVGLELSGTTAHVAINNATYDQPAQALGRTARIMTRALPASVETFRITFSEKGGMPGTTVTLRRSDLERLEHAPADQTLAAAHFDDSLRYGGMPAPVADRFPRFNWAIAPFTRISLFDPDNPVRADVALRFEAQAELGKGWVADGGTSVKLFGNLDKTTQVSNSRLPRVRSDAAIYAREDGPRLDWLTLSKYHRLAPDIFARATVGYLEQMYAGASAEVLWRPVNSRLAIGGEVNYVQPRDFDGGFGLRSRRTVSGTIPEFNGHASIYYDFGNGFHGQVDAGRYLAGDWGATISLDREFENGWRVGAFATKTDVSAQDFGEGSFDKGIRITAPVSWLLGTPTRQSPTAVIRSLTRDGGQRLNVRGRLYDTVRPSRQTDIADSWGKFWR